MTTIAYSAAHGVLAGDTLVSGGSGPIFGYTRKVFRIGGALVALVGAANHSQAFLSWIQQGMQGAPPDMGDADADETWGQVFIFPGGDLGSDMVARYRGAGPPQFYRAAFSAFGSGGEIALGAMEAGKTPQEAVEIAMRWDTGTGGDIIEVRHSR